MGLGKGTGFSHAVKLRIFDTALAVAVFYFGNTRVFQQPVLPSKQKQRKTGNHADDRKRSARTIAERPSTEFPPVSGCFPDMDTPYIGRYCERLQRYE